MSLGLARQAGMDCKLQGAVGMWFWTSIRYLKNTATLFPVSLQNPRRPVLSGGEEAESRGGQPQTV